MRSLFAVALTGLDGLLLHPLRSLVTLTCAVIVLLPYLTGLAISQGIRDQAETAIRVGADLYVTGSRFGRDVPLPLTAAKAVGEVDGVEAVIPRIVGGLVLGNDRAPVVVVGLPPEHWPAGLDCVEGALPSPGPLHELVIGTELAHRLHWRVGDVLPPFYHNRAGERLARVVGIFRSEVSLWQAHLVLTTFDSAAAIFDQPGLATDLLVTCRPGYAEQVQKALQRAGSTPADGSPGWRVTGRADLESLLPRGLLHREGIFNLFSLLTFVAALLVILVTSGFGEAGRRREIGILKATGWQTDEILVRGAVESILLGLTSAAIAVLLGLAWLRWLNGYGIASVFLAGVDAVPSFQVPYRLLPLPAFLAGLLSVVIVLTGTLYASWRAAITPPLAAMRSAR